MLGEPVEPAMLGSRVLALPGSRFYLRAAIHGAMESVGDRDHFFSDVERTARVGLCQSFRVFLFDLRGTATDIFAPRISADGAISGRPLAHGTFFSA